MIWRENPSATLFKNLNEVIKCTLYHTNFWKTLLSKNEWAYYLFFYPSIKIFYIQLLLFFKICIDFLSVFRSALLYNITQYRKRPAALLGLLRADRSLLFLFDIQLKHFTTCTILTRKCLSILRKKGPKCIQAPGLAD